MQKTTAERDAGRSEKKSEMEDNAERGLAVVLRLTENVGVHPIGFETSGPPGIDVVVDSSAGQEFKSILTTESGLGKNVHSANQDVDPRFKLIVAEGNFGSGAVGRVFYVLVQINGRSKRGGRRAFDREPIPYGIR